MNGPSPRTAIELLVEAWRQLRVEREARREAETDRDAYRLLAHAALAQLADLTRSHRRLQERVRALLDKRRNTTRRAA